MPLLFFFCLVQVRPELVQLEEVKQGKGLNQGFVLSTHKFWLRSYRGPLSKSAGLELDRSETDVVRAIPLTLQRMGCPETSPRHLHSSSGLL